MINQMTPFRSERQTRFKPNLIYSVLGLFILGALAGLIWNLTQGATTIHFASIPFRDSSFSFGARIDTLSTIMLAMVTLLGTFIGHYSVRYLAEEERQPYFFRYLFLTLFSTSLLVTSSNLILFFLAWLGTSLSLHKLLIYYENRPQAVGAARKKFIISRIGDLSLLLAIFLTYTTFNTLDFHELFEKAKLLSDGSEQSLHINLIGFLFALGAMSKSAQFPFHFWLPETMEAPTPVSALMHAGVINAGGFLIIRLSPILEHATAAHILLATIGATTAVFAALVMITQNHLKSKLAYSTISQMGMMLFACGLGAYSLALFHIIAHSFYKAYAFLSTGMQVEESKKIGLPQNPQSKMFLGAVTGVGLALILLGLTHQEGRHLPYYTYGAVIILGIFQNLGGVSVRTMGSLLFSRVSLILITLVTLFLIIEYQLNLLLKPLVPNIHDSIKPDSTQSFLFIGCYLIFASGFWLSAYLPLAQGYFMKRLYCYFWNGGYFTAYSSVFLEKFFGKSELKKQDHSQLPATEHANA